MKKLSFITIFALALITVGIAFAAESIRYDFDDVEVKFAAGFTAKPVNVDPDNWIVQVAGGVDKPISVLYGVVDLKKDGVTQISEEFIKVEGQGGSERFLVNSATYDYYEGTSNYQEIKSFFWSAKKIIDNNVVKDFTPPIKSISVYRKFKESQELDSIALSFSSEGEKATQEFWSGVPTENLYEVDKSINIDIFGAPWATISQ